MELKYFQRYWNTFCKMSNVRFHSPYAIFKILSLVIQKTIGGGQNIYNIFPFYTVLFHRRFSPNDFTI